MASSHPMLEDMASTKLTAEQAVEIGERYLAGNLLRRNDKSARWFFRFAAGRKHPVGQCNLADMMLHGRGGPQGEAGARALYAKAAVQGLPAAQNNLADMMLHGRGGLRDEVGARALYAMAARQGFPEAQNNLAVMMMEGIDGRRDLPGAWKLFTAAAKAGFEESQLYLRYLRDKVPNDLAGLRDEPRSPRHWNNLRATVGRPILSAPGLETRP